MVDDYDVPLLLSEIKSINWVILVSKLDGVGPIDNRPFTD